MIGSWEDTIDIMIGHLVHDDRVICSLKVRIVSQCKLSATSRERASERPLDSDGIVV